ncbi:MAG TPA: D-tyrosyl-tRNA(Tyr) deacylase [Eggerthellaceae bacterium]|nr:D-tyrosyl-tRNA(Tyr) deacylase [Eggerthellaceae bacterium]
MRAVVQRVSEASVRIGGEVAGSCGHGFLVLLGVGEGDTEAEVEQLWNKIFKLRIFPDGEKHTGKALGDVDGEVLVVSQFTLFADCRKGNRPSFAAAGAPDESEHLYQLFVERARRDVRHVATGEFGADMAVSLVNDGPFTICLDTDDLKRPRR